jgi:addiction module HigA family antidote
MNITKRKPFSPGEMLVGEFLEPLNLTYAQLADRIKIPHNLMNDIINNRHEINSDIAIRLGKVFGTSAEVWLNLQMKWNLWHDLYESQNTSEYESIRRFEFKNEKLALSPSF